MAASRAFRVRIVLPRPDSRWARKSNTADALRSSITSWSTGHLHRAAEYWRNSFIESRYEAVVWALTPRSIAKYRRKKLDNRVARGGFLISTPLLGSGIQTELGVAW